MINTKAFKTRSEIIEKKLPRINGNNQYKGKTIVALDIGYSGVKGASPNRVFTFPSYAKKTPKDLDVVGKVRPSDIQLRNDKTGECWLVGQAAETMMDQVDIESTTDASLYTRYRYDSEVFKVLAMTGMALGLWGTGSGNDIYLQTGLPATYKDRDEGKIVSALCGDYAVSIKVGSGDWVPFQFTLDENHIDVMEQPQGTLCATAYDNGVVSQMGKDILRSNSIILDIGFGTEDIFSIRSGYKNAHQTYSDTGMRAVFEAVIKQLQADHKNYALETKIFELQRYMENGEVPYFDADEFQMHNLPFADILEEKNREICDKSIRRLMQDYGNLVGYNYLIVTGGTGESRFEQIKEMLSGLPTLQVLPGNLNTQDLAFSYSNVMGYYMLRHAKLAAEVRKLGMTQ
jgi:plasmid segregation protein ParM